MKNRLIILGILALLFVASVASADHVVYLDPQMVCMPESNTVTVQVRMNASDSIDTWSTMIKFDDGCVNITEVDFTGSITPTNAAWGHHVNYIYLSGTELTASSGSELLLATLTVERVGSGCTSPLDFVGEVDVTRLVAGPSASDPLCVTVYSATWTNGCVTIDSGMTPCEYYNDPANGGDGGDNPKEVDKNEAVNALWDYLLSMGPFADDGPFVKQDALDILWTYLLGGWC